MPPGAVGPTVRAPAAIAIHTARSSSDDTYELRLLADCQVVFGDNDVAFLATVELLEGLTSIDEAPWSDIRGKPITAHFVGKLLKPFGIASTRHRVGGVSNPIRGYLRADFESAWSRYLLPHETGTSGTTGTAYQAEHEMKRSDVPDVPVVPLVRDTRIEDGLALTRAAWRVFADDVEWVIGTA